MTDTKRDEYSDIDTTIIKMLEMLEGVDYKDILNMDGIIINGKDLLKIVDKMSNDRKEGYKHE